ncbi:J domain-containing protein [Halorientalis pallida]|uniref:J domain-containing protein n=1 Tax=Halorientalis pallida TaxID=2479928 RepID=UPI003C6EBA64
MAETFYSVLGVESDADVEAIRDAYRAQVKETHPDVSDDADAADSFKRLTAARDVLVDEASRSRYDRVGHTAYVRDHLDSSAWSVEDAGSAGPAAGSGSSNTSTQRGTDEDENAENYQRYRSSHAEASSSGRDRSRRTGRTGRRERTDRTTGTDTGTGNSGGAGTTDSGAGGTDTSASEASGSDASGSDTDEYGTWSTDAGQDWAFSGSSSSSTSTATGGHSADPRDRARADGWQAAHASTNAYTPSGYEPTAAATSDVGVGSLRDVLRQVGPWLAFHFVFLISAFVTIWLIMSWIPSVPMLFVSLLLLGATVFFSILHMVSQVYS